MFTKDLIVITEGIGKHVPKPVVMEIRRHWRLLCDDESKRRQARDDLRGDSWGKGLIHNPHYVGLIAECAVSEFLGKPIDFSFGYDKGFDLKLNGIKLDVKATLGKMPLIKQLKKQRCHRFVMCKVDDTSVTILGWISHNDVIDKPLVKSMRGSHLNHEVNAVDMRNANELKASGGCNLLRYPGGKARLWNGKLDRFMPTGSMFAPSRLVEPMVGGGGITLQALKVCEFKSALLADLDKSLICLWLATRDRKVELIRRVENWTPNVDDWILAKEVDGKLDDIVEAAFNKLVLHYCSHGGIGFMAGGPQGGIAQESEYLIGCRWNPTRIAATIFNASKLLRKSEIVCCDFGDLRTSQDDFIVVDPPYVTAGKGLYRHCFGESDHERLAKWVLNGKCDEWVVTYDDSPLVRSLYAGCKFVEVENSSGNNLSKIELFITPKQN